MRATACERWGADYVVARGVCYEVANLEGFVAWAGGDRTGIVTYLVAGDTCEVVTLDSLQENAGVGTALMAAVADSARSAGCRRLTLITTNDNFNALRFYQKRGMRLIGLYPGALANSRKLKPQIPEIGNDGIPLRDELELELLLSV